MQRLGQIGVGDHPEVARQTDAKVGKSAPLQFGPEPADHRPRQLGIDESPTDRRTVDEEKRVVVKPILFTPPSREPARRRVVKRGHVACPEAISPLCQPSCQRRLPNQW